MRFRPEQHLRRPGEIRAVREQGRRVDCRAFTVWWKCRATPATPGKRGSRAIAKPRACVIASSAAVGGAVQRNRAKRRLREVFRQQQHLVPPDCDLLLIARSSATSWDMDVLHKKFAEACAQISPAPKAGVPAE